MRGLFFRLEELKNYIAYIENEAPDANGLRVYFGAYAKNDKNADKKALSTVFFVPTKPKVGSLQKDSVMLVDSSDITDIEGMNNGSTGHPPSAPYPQTY